MNLYSQLLVCFSRSDAIFLNDQAWSVVQITHSTHALYKLGTVGSTSNIFKTNKTNNNSQGLLTSSFIANSVNLSVLETDSASYLWHPQKFLFIYLFISCFFVVCFRLGKWVSKLRTQRKQLIGTCKIYHHELTVAVLSLRGISIC